MTEAPKPRKHKSKPVQRSLAHMDKNGWTTAIVEKYIKHPGMEFGRRVDVWGFGDLLACRPPMNGRPGVTALVQCCRAADMAEHRDKVYAIKEFYDWRDAGNRVFLQGWSMKGARGETKRWTLSEEVLTEEAFMRGMGFVQILRCGRWEKP